MTEATTAATTSKREERWFALRLFVLLAAVVGGFFGLIILRGKISSSKYPRVKLTDGSWLVARHVSVGKSHGIEIPYPLSVQFRRWQQSYNQPYTTSEDRTVVWLMRENDRGEQLDLDWVKRVEVDVGDARDLKPSQYHRQSIQSHSSSGTGTGATGFSDAKAFGSGAPVEIGLIHFEVPIVRPRDRAMKVKVFDGSDNMVVELPIPFPKLADLSTELWEPDPLPASRTDGDLTVTLNSVEFFESADTDGVYVSPRLSFVHRGEQSQTWGAIEELQDLLGNKSYAWNCDLSPSESAWKLHLRMAQRPDGNFLPEETRKLPLRPLVPARQLNAVSESHVVNGATVSLVGIGGHGPLSFTLPHSNSNFTTATYQAGAMGYGMSTRCSNNKCDVEFSSGLPFVITTDRLGQDGLQTQLVFRDQNGEVLQQRGNSGIEKLLFWFFEPKPTSTDIEIEIITQKQRHAEFLIAPPTPDQIKKR